jgi:hypothetical protein
VTAVAAAPPEPGAVAVAVISSRCISVLVLGVGN